MVAVTSLQTLDGVHVTVRIHAFSTEKLELGLLVFRMDGCDVTFEMRKFLNTLFG